MPKLLKTPTQLKAKITKLEQQNHQLRTYLHEIIDLAYQIVNKDPQKEKEEKEC